MKKAWVIGAGGLLGSHIREELQAQSAIQLFNPSAQFAWHQSETLLQQLTVAVEDFAQTVAPDDEWVIFWAAGIGTMHSTEQDLAGETHFFTHLVQRVLHSSLSLSKGVFQFASSAGALYAGSTEGVITESSLVLPINPYAREKLKQEQILKKAVSQNPQLTVLITRISTLYGNRVKQASSQGLLAKMSHQVVRNQPIHIYVPLETMRDYIHAQDAARGIVRTTLITLQKRGGFFIKLIASEKAYSIAEIIAIFKRAAHKNIKVIHYGIPTTTYYKNNIQYRSRFLRNDVDIPARNLLIGIAQLLQSERLLYGHTKIYQQKHS